MIDREFRYKPLFFYLIVATSIIIATPITAHLSLTDQVDKLTLLLIGYLILPSVAAVSMIYFSRNKKDDQGSLVAAYTL